jgi:hypothetical protein
MHMTYKTVLDPYGDLKREFDVFARPTTLFINQDGDVVSRQNGPINELQLQLRLQELLENVQWQSERESPACMDGGNCGKYMGEPLP